MRKITRDMGPTEYYKAHEELGDICSHLEFILNLLHVEDRCMFDIFYTLIFRSIQTMKKTGISEEYIKKEIENVKKSLEMALKFED